MKLIKKNKKSKDCGVVAAFNAASWCNLYKSYREVEKLAMACGYNENGGMYSFQFANLIKMLGLPAKKTGIKTIETLEKNLRNGKLYIIFYIFAESDEGHIVAVFADHEGRIRLINPEKEESHGENSCRTCRKLA